VDDADVVAHWRRRKVGKDYECGTPENAQEHILARIKGYTIILSSIAVMSSMVATYTTCMV